MNFHLLLNDTSRNPVQHYAGEALLRVCAQASIVRSAAQIEPYLCQMLDMTMAAEFNYPLAAISRLGEGGSISDDYYCLVYPVHLQLQRDFFSLGEALVLSSAEWQVLCDSLNQHFAAQGLFFSVAQDLSYGYLRFASDPQLRAMQPHGLHGQDVRAFMPQGQGAALWRKYLNEIQMLLHEHALNQKREVQGLPAVNSLWLAGGGMIPATSSLPASTSGLLLANDALAAGLAKWRGLPAAALPVDAQQAIAQGTAYNHVYAVLHDMQAWEQNWLQPLLRALKKRQLRQLHVYFQSGLEVVHLQIRPWQLWQFWRKAVSLEDVG